jgi:hypothetical protein
MLTIVGLVVGVVVLAGALKRLSRRNRMSATASPVTGAARSTPDWRLARDEGPTLRQAVEVMEGHADVLRQLGDGWLVAANQKVREPGTFRANVLHARSLRTLIEDECVALISELRDLEHKRDSVGVFDVRREQAHALADWAAVLNAGLRERLQTLANERGLEMNNLLSDAAKQGGRLDGATVDQWLPRFSEGGELRLNEVVG